MIVTKAFPSLVTSHSCFSEKFRMGAPQSKKAINTFCTESIFHYFFDCIMVTQKILVVVIGHFDK